MRGLFVAIIGEIQSNKLFFGCNTFKEATEEIIETNDNIQDFIDVKLTITTNGKAVRIGKNKMIEIYKKMFPNRGMNHQLLKSSLSNRGLGLGLGFYSG